MSRTSRKRRQRNTRANAASRMKKAGREAVSRNPSMMEQLEPRLLLSYPAPLAYYDLNETSGTIAADDSGNSYDGTVVGGTFAAGKYGNGISLDGTNDYVDLGDRAAFDFDGSSFTYALWTNDVADAGWMIAEGRGSMRGWGIMSGRADLNDGDGPSNAAYFDWVA